MPTLLLFQGDVNRYGNTGAVCAPLQLQHCCSPDVFHGWGLQLLGLSLFASSPPCNTPQVLQASADKDCGSHSKYRINTSINRIDMQLCNWLCRLMLSQVAAQRYVLLDSTCWRRCMHSWPDGERHKPVMEALPLKAALGFHLIRRPCLPPSGFLHITLAQ